MSNDTGDCVMQPDNETKVRRNISCHLIGAKRGAENIQMSLITTAMRRFVCWVSLFWDPEMGSYVKPAS